MGLKGRDPETEAVVVVAAIEIGVPFAPFTRFARVFLPVGVIVSG